MRLRLSQHQAYPSPHAGLRPSFVHSAAIPYARHCVRTVGSVVHRHSRGSAPLPQRPSLRSELYCLGPSTLNRPHAPHSWAHPDFTVLPLIRDALAVLVRLGDPGVVLCFRCSFLVNMPSSQTPGSPSAAFAQFFAHGFGLRQESTDSALPLNPSSASDEGRISWLHRFALATACPLACPPGGSDRAFHPANRDFYSRAFGELVTLLTVGYNYGGT